MWRCGLGRCGRRLGGALALGVWALAGCTPVEAPAGPAEAAPAACCRDLERTPAWIVRASEPLMPLVGPALGTLQARPGHLADQATARRLVMSKLRPLDVMLVSHKGRFSGHTVPGHFAHGIVYLGTETEIRALGLWDDPAVRPHRDEIRSGHVFIEASLRSVHLTAPDEVLNADRMIVMRPRLGASRRREVALQLFRRIGVPFDYRFDADSEECDFCTELIYRVLPELELPVREAYGRRTVVPDDIALRAVSSDPRLSFVLAVEGTPSGWRQLTGKELAGEIETDWQRRPPPPRPPAH